MKTTEVKMDIQEKNEVLAEFMGLQYRSSTPNKGKYWFNPFDRENILPTFDLQFHSSWDWLMSVVDKAGTLPSLGDVDGIYTNIIKSLGRSNGKYRHDAVFEACVEFVMWYRAQKTTNNQ